MAGWREDLQGKRRSNFKNREDILVQTNYGEVQGFKVDLFDEPNLQHRRPTPAERKTASVDSFLGIPYAMPPVLEGRFRPPRVHKYDINYYRSFVNKTNN